MNTTAESYFKEVMSGRQTGAVATLLRASAACAEPIYDRVTRLRNAAFDHRVFASAAIDRPVISVGNLTAGGTGKTPMVRWLAERLLDGGISPAILSRGYKSAAGQLGDEGLMLDQLLNSPQCRRVILRADPDRAAAARSVLHEFPGVGALILDDGFQHRRCRRDLDIVLLSATDPFGLNHILPRGLLREHPRGLSRAGAIVITHADQVSPDALAQTEARVRTWAPQTPVYHAVHALTGFRTAEAPAHRPVDRPVESLANRRPFMFCGIGNPLVLHRQLLSLSTQYKGYRVLPDHHAYSADDLAAVTRSAKQAGADLLVTTEKDWVKIAPLLPAAPEIALWRVDAELRLSDDGSDQLMRQVLHAVRRPGLSSSR